MFTVYPTKMKAIKTMYRQFETEAEAKQYIASRNNPVNYTLQNDNPTNKKFVKSSIDFTNAVQITRNNNKYFYNKAGYIKVINPVGKVLHIGKTKNMGKVFSNYVNCAKYNQSYDFNLDGGDRLFFVEAKIE